MTQNIHHPFDWTFSDDTSASSLMPRDLDWANPASIRQANLIKENDQRQVWRVILNGSAYYAKLYLNNGILSRLKRYFRGPVCLKEWTVARYALRHGINCVHPLAYAVSSGTGTSVDCLLITAGIPQTVPLTDYWMSITQNDAPDRAGRITNLEDALAELLARAHQAGLSHSDLHPGNLLVEPRESGRPVVCLVDLHSVRVGHPVSDREAIHNLAQLNQWFRQNATLTQRMRLLKRYMACRKNLAEARQGQRWSDRNFKHWAVALDRAARRHAEKLNASRDRRIMRDGKYFGKINLPDHWRAHVFLQTKHPTGYSQTTHLEFTAEEWKNTLTSPEKLLDEFSRYTRPIKHSRSTLVCRGNLQIGRHNLPVVTKRHISRKPFAALWDCLRKSRALKAWKLSFAMRHRQLPVAQPLAVLERRIGPYLTNSILITEEVKPCVNLRTFITSVLPTIPQDRRYAIKTHLTDQLAALLRKMHQNGFAHRDMKATNILIQNLPSELTEAVDPKSLQVVLVDLDGLRIKDPSQRDQIRALVRLSLSADLSTHVTQTDRARFLKSYLTCYGSGVPDWKSLWRTIQLEREKSFQDHIPG